MQNLKKIVYSALTFTFLVNLNIPINSTEREVKVYSGRHYNTDREVYKKFANETADTEEEAARWLEGDKSARRPPELLTRDVVARAINTEVKAGRGSEHGGILIL